MAGANIKAGDEILITTMEHHSNIVPWQMLVRTNGGDSESCADQSNKARLIYNRFEQMLTAKTKLVAVGHMSNALGTINPVKDIIEAAHALNIPVLTRWCSGGSAYGC